MMNHTITMLSLRMNNLSINMIKNTSDISSKIKTIIKTLPTWYFVLSILKVD